MLREKLEIFSSSPADTSCCLFCTEETRQPLPSSMKLGSYKTRYVFQQFFLCCPLATGMKLTYHLQFWWSFAYPLLQIVSRRFTLITTPVRIDLLFRPSGFAFWWRLLILPFSLRAATSR